MTITAKQPIQERAEYVNSASPLPDLPPAMTAEELDATRNPEAKYVNSASSLPDLPPTSAEESKRWLDAAGITSAASATSLPEPSPPAPTSPDDTSLDFTGIKFINPGEYGDLSSDAHKCVALAQSEMLAVSVMVYQVTPDFTGVIKGNVATVGRETVVQEIDLRFTPKPDIPHLMLHEKSALNSEVKPGDEVVIRYADGSAKVIPVDKNAKYAYDIDFEGDATTLKRIAEFLALASWNGSVRLTSDKIAEVVGNAVTQAHLVAFEACAVKRPDLVSVAITEYVKTLDLQQEAIRVSEKLLKAHENGYRLDLQESTRPQVVFVGTPKEVEKKRRGMRM